MEVKPGFKTTEFYAMAAGIIVTLMLASNVIGESEQADWQAMVVEMLPGAGGIIMYIWSRTKVKTG